MNNQRDSSLDDATFDATELENAVEDVQTEVRAPEVDAGTEQLTAWDDAPDATGSAAPRVLPEDEISPVETLVYDGVEEADREQRIAAVDPDYQP